MDAPQIVVCSIIFRDGKFLLVKRAREPFNGLWSIIGGLSIMNKDHSSDPLQASKDEVFCDIQCEFINPKFYKYVFREENKPTICLFFYGDIKGTPHPNREYVSNQRWFSLHEIKDMELAFEHKKILHEFIEDILKIL